MRAPLWLGNGVRDLGSAGYRTGCKRLGSVTVYNHGYCGTREEATMNRPARQAGSWVKLRSGHIVVHQ